MRERASAWGSSHVARWVLTARSSPASSAPRAYEAASSSTAEQFHGLPIAHRLASSRTGASKVGARPAEVPLSGVAELRKRKTQAAGGCPGRHTGQLGDLAIGVPLEVGEARRPDADRSAAPPVRRRGRRPPRARGHPPRWGSDRCAGASARRRRRHQSSRDARGRDRSPDSAPRSSASLAGIHVARRSGRSSARPQRTHRAPHPPLRPVRRPRATQPRTRSRAYRSYSSPSAPASPDRIRSASRASTRRSSFTLHLPIERRTFAVRITRDRPLRSSRTVERAPSIRDAT